MSDSEREATWSETAAAWKRLRIAWHNYRIAVHERAFLNHFERIIEIRRDHMEATNDK